MATKPKLFTIVKQQKTAPQHLGPILIKKMAINFNSMASHRSSRINSDTHLSCSSCADCFIFITNFSSSAILLALLFNTAFNFGCSFCNVVSCFTTYSTNGLGIKNLTQHKEYKCYKRNIGPAEYLMVKLRSHPKLPKSKP